MADFDELIKFIKSKEICDIEEYYDFFEEELELRFPGFNLDNYEKVQYKVWKDLTCNRYFLIDYTYGSYDGDTFHDCYEVFPTQKIIITYERHRE